MKDKGLTGGILKVIDDSQVKSIHETAIHILEEVGVEIFSHPVREILRERGARVKNDSRAYLSRGMVEWAISSAPPSVLLAGQTEENDLHLEGNRVFLGTGGVGLRIFETKTGQRRPATLKDLAAIARLCDYLENIHFFLRPVEPPDLPPVALDLCKFYIALSNTRKHVMGGVYRKESATEVMHMASMIAGGLERLRERPFISFICQLISPLRHDTETIETLVEIVKNGIPVALGSSPVAGSTGPATLAGTMALAHAEVLSGIVLAQLIHPGTPVLYGPIPRPVNWRSMKGLKGGIESGLMNAAMTRISNFIKIPQYADAGGTEAKAPDIQAGYEKALNILLVALAGGNYIHHAAGLLESDTVACYEQYILDNDIIGMVLRTLEGLKIGEGSLAFEVLERVGPGGNFLTDPHTLQNLRTGEIFIPCTANRNDSDPIEKARAKAEEILDHHRIEVDRGIDEAIRKRFDLIVTKEGEWIP